MKLVVKSNTLYVCINGRYCMASQDWEVVVAAALPDGVPPRVILPPLGDDLIQLSSKMLGKGRPQLVDLLNQLSAIRKTRIDMNVKTDWKQIWDLQLEEKLAKLKELCPGNGETTKRSCDLTDAVCHVVNAQFGRWNSWLEWLKWLENMDGEKSAPCELDEEFFSRTLINLMSIGDRRSKKIDDQVYDDVIDHAYAGLELLRNCQYNCQYNYQDKLPAMLIRLVIMQQTLRKVLEQYRYVIVETTAIVSQRCIEEFARTLSESRGIKQEDEKTGKKKGNAAIKRVVESMADTDRRQRANKGVAMSITAGQFETLLICTYQITDEERQGKKETRLKSDRSRFTRLEKHMKVLTLLDFPRLVHEYGDCSVIMRKNKLISEYLSMLASGQSCDSELSADILYIFSGFETDIPFSGCNGNMELISVGMLNNILSVGAKQIVETGTSLLSELLFVRSYRIRLVQISAPDQCHDKYYDVGRIMTVKMEKLIADHIKDLVNKVLEFEAFDKIPELRRKQLELWRKHHKIVVMGAELPDFDKVWDYYLRTQRTKGKQFWETNFIKVMKSQYRRKDTAFYEKKELSLNVEWMLLLMRLVKDKDIQDMRDWIRNKYKESDLSFEKIGIKMCSFSDTLAAQCAHYEGQADAKASENLMKMAEKGNLLCMYLIIELAWDLHDSTRPKDGRKIDKRFLEPFTNFSGTDWATIFNEYQIMKLFLPNAEISDGFEAYGTAMVISSGQWDEYRRMSVIITLRDRTWDVVGCESGLSDFIERLNDHDDSVQLFHMIMSKNKV